MSYDGAVIIGWGSMARDQGRKIVQELIDSKDG